LKDYGLKLIGEEMNKFIKKLFGIDKIETRIEQALAEADKAKQVAEEATDAAERAQEAERAAKLGPKERATEKKEPWVAVLETHVNKDNLRNGFFELDWNEYFVLQLRTAGYIGETEEEVVDEWFSELCRNRGAEEGIDMSRRGAGYVNRALRDDGRSEVS
jgi:pyruvate/2-oxoglutarate dehydrogenase complex dihydrolipoamide acyltransferase (E2) component